MSICTGCNGKLVGEYLSASGKHWHVGCLVCARCKKAIQDKHFVNFSGSSFHKLCFTCFGCKRQISDSYSLNGKQIWHPECLRRSNRKPCSVCRKGLTKSYLIDFWGNSFCDIHKKYKTCNSCSRIICKNLTDGGIQYPDGVAICNICSLTSISTISQALPIYEEMKMALTSIGIKLHRASVPLKLCSRKELHEGSRHNFHENRPILGLARWVTTKSGGQVVGRYFKDILIQKDLPETHFRLVAIHELMHAWFFYNQYYELPLYIEEGFCVLMEYIWLKNKKTKDSQYRKILIEKNEDPVYGYGFRKVRKCLHLMPLKKLLDFVQDKNKLPNKLTAFFY